MKKVKIYDLKSILENIKFEDNSNYSLVQFEEGLAILEGTTGILVFDNKFKSYSFKSHIDKFTIELMKKNSFFNTSSCILVSLSKIINSKFFKEVYLNDFLNISEDYNSISTKFSNIGLDINDFYSENNNSKKDTENTKNTDSYELNNMFDYIEDNDKKTSSIDSKNSSNDSEIIDVQE